MHDTAYEMHTCIITRTPSELRSSSNKQVRYPHCILRSQTCERVAAACLWRWAPPTKRVALHLCWLAWSQRAEELKQQTGKIPALHRARVRIASSTGATSRYSVFTKPVRVLPSSSLSAGLPRVEVRASRDGQTQCVVSLRRP